MSIVGHLKDYKLHLDSWSKVQLSVQMNIKAISIILEKFRLYNVQEVIPYDDDRTMNAILNSYYIPIDAPPSTGRYKKQLSENLHSTDRSSGAHTLGDLSYEPINDVDLDLSELRHTEELHIPTKSPLLASLMINHPGTITLFLQKQSNKIMQLIFEIKAMYDDFKKRHLPKMQSIYEACEVYRNRMVCTHVPEDILEPKDDPSPVIESFQSINTEMNDIYNFCRSMNSYPTDDSEIKRYLNFTQEYLSKF